MADTHLGDGFNHEYRDYREQQCQDSFASSLCALIIFSSPTFGDQLSMAYFLQDHNEVHFNLSQVTGNVIGFTDLSGPIDEDWLSRHRLQHVAFYNALLTPAVGLTPPSIVDVPSLEDEGVFYRWMQAHNDLHSQLDQALGLT